MSTDWSRLNSAWQSGSLGRLQNEAQYELTTLLFFFIKTQITTQAYCKSFTNIESNSVTALIHPTRWFVLSLKVHLKQVLSVLGSDTYSLISYTNVDTEAPFLIDKSEFVNGNLNYIFALGELYTVLD